MFDPMSYEQFEQDWLRRHKRSLPSRRRISSWGLIGGILVWSIIAIGAALVSGAHSVPAIHQTIPTSVPEGLRSLLSLAGFTIFELLIFAGALYRRDSPFAKYGLWLSMIGALAANIGSSVYAVTENRGDWLNMVVGVVLAFIAPLAAFLAGEMVHRLAEQHKEKIGDAAARYRDALGDVDKQINRDYKAYLRELSKTAVQNPSNGPSNGQTGENLRPSASILGHAKRPDASAIVQAHLLENPEDIEADARQLAARLGVGKSTVNNVQRYLKSQNGQNKLQ